MRFCHTEKMKYKQTKTVMKSGSIRSLLTDALKKYDWEFFVTKFLPGIVTESGTGITCLY